jgi:hypothetical protein
LSLRHLEQDGCSKSQRFLALRHASQPADGYTMIVSLPWGVNEHADGIPSRGRPLVNGHRKEVQGCLAGSIV